VYLKQPTSRQCRACQAPVITFDQASLALDTEFLFNDKVVAGTGRIVLPRICIATGATELLVERESRLWWCNRWIATARSIMILATLFCAIPMLKHLPPTVPGVATQDGIFALLQLGGGVVIIVAAIALVAASYVFCNSIQVRWFISEQTAEKIFARRLLSLLIVFAVTTVCWFLIGARWRGVTMMATIWAVVSLFLLVRGNRILFVAGKLDGLFLIGGLSEKFLAETQRLVDTYVAKDK